MNNAKREAQREKRIIQLLMIFISGVLFAATISLIIVIINDENEEKLPNGLVYSYIESYDDNDMTLDEIYNRACGEYPMTTIVSRDVWEHEMEELNYTRADLDGMFVSLEEVLTRKNSKIIVIKYSSDTNHLVDIE